LHSSKDLPRKQTNITEQIYTGPSLIHPGVSNSGKALNLSMGNWFKEKFNSMHG